MESHCCISIDYVQKELATLKLTSELERIHLQQQINDINKRQNNLVFDLCTIEDQSKERDMDLKSMIED